MPSHMPSHMHRRVIADSPLVEGPESRPGERSRRRMNRMTKAAILVALVLLPFASAAAVYRCQAANGSVIFADSPCGPDAQVQAERTPPPISETALPPIGGATGSRGAVDARARQRNESSACWLAKYAQWQRSQPKSLTGSSAIARAKMVEFENECHWTPRTPVAVAMPRLDVQAARPAVAGAKPTPVPASPARADTLDAYLSDARLLTSRQAATPAAPIQYSDPANGALLKAILNPARAMAMVELTVRAGDMGRFDELKHLLEPVQKRYATAFNANPRLYEPEYLDTLEISAMLLRSSGSLMQLAQAASTRAASSSGSGARLDQASGALAQSMNGLMASVGQMMAKGIRQQVAAGKFSPAGAQRASGIANSLMPAT